METITLKIPGDPKAQKRHRHARIKGTDFIKTYDPSSADKTDFYWMCYNQRPKTVPTCPVSLNIEFYFQRPKSHYGTGSKNSILKSSAPVFHTSKPDIDNLCKMPIDALTGIYWKDDTQIVELTAIKHYITNYAPYTQIIIEYHDKY